MKKILSGKIYQIITIVLFSVFFSNSFAVETDAFKFNFNPVLTIQTPTNTEDLGEISAGNYTSPDREITFSCSTGTCTSDIEIGSRDNFHLVHENDISSKIPFSVEFIDSNQTIDSNSAANNEINVNVNQSTIEIRKYKIHYNADTTDLKKGYYKGEISFTIVENAGADGIS